MRFIECFLWFIKFVLLKQQTKSLFAFTFIVLSVFLFYPKSVSAEPIVSSISDNRSVYINSQIPKHSKLEITFNVDNTVAKNFAMPYDPNPPLGVTSFDSGITVDGEFSSDNWQTIYKQPGFYYQNFDYQIRYGGQRDWLYPMQIFSWKIRFSPAISGNWQYRIRTTDSSGSSVSNPISFIAVNSNNPGFVRVSKNNSKYFEFDNGDYFPGLGYNMNSNRISWTDPVVANSQNFQTMGQNGIQLVRMWLSQWSIFGSIWNPWFNIDNHSTDPPFAYLTGNQTSTDGSEWKIYVSNSENPCMFYGFYQSGPAVKPNTTYRVRVRYTATNMSGPQVSGRDWGFAVKVGPWLAQGQDQHGGNSDIAPDGRDDSCKNYWNGTVITNHANQNTSDWQTIEGTYTTGSGEYFLPFLYLSMDNIATAIPTPWVTVDHVWLEEDLGNGNYGVNIIAKPSMDHHRYFDQRNSFAFDKVVELAEQNGVYLRPVTMDHRDYIFNKTNNQGQIVTQSNAGYLYGYDDRSMTKNRWLQKAWWRYLQARWGYSTAIHSWEYVNEGTPGVEHAVAADVMGEYFQSFAPYDHLVSTSRWSGSTASWNLNNYSNIDFADVHRYTSLSSDPNLFDDTSEATINASNTWGAISTGGRTPIVRGETGFTDSGSEPGTNLIPCTHASHNGLWLHNFIWAGINSNALIESYWYEMNHIYPRGRIDCNGDGIINQSDPNINYDIRPVYKTYYEFIKNVPLNKFVYTDLQATGFDTNIIRVVGQKDVIHNRAHVWIQNKENTWRSPNTIGANANILISGFSPNTELKVQTWNTFAGTTTNTQTISTNSSGVLTLSVSSLVTDTAFKIGDYEEVGGPTPTQSQLIQGDTNEDGSVDGVDYVIWLNHYDQDTTGGHTVGDFNGSGIVDGIDYVIWLNNYSG